jgi:hypothetical protein
VSVYTILSTLVHRRSPLTGGDYTSPTLVPEVAVGSSEANIVTSELTSNSSTFADEHKLLIDLDVPACLIPSTTPGHSHLYIDVTTSSTRLFKVLDALADAGAVERGYAEASRARGYSALRLPWIKKTAPKAQKAGPFA